MVYNKVIGVSDIMVTDKYDIVKFEELNSEYLSKNRNKIIGINKDGLTVYINIKLKLNNKNLVVFSNGAINLSKSKPPVFSRSSWASDFNANCIFIDDTTIHNTNMTVGWGVGTQERYYLLDYLEIVKKISSLLDIENKNILFFGSSAGGFMSIMYSIFMKGTVAVANNPQIWVRKETQASRATNLYNNVFPGMSETEILERFGERLSVIRMIEKMKYTPKIYYIINRYSKKDIEEQYELFTDYIDGKEILDNDTEIISYHSSKGHNGIYTRAQSVQFINGYFNRDISAAVKEEIEIKQADNIFEVKNSEDKVLDTIGFKDTIYIPIDYILKDNYVSYKFQFSLKKGKLELKLFSKYYNYNNPNNLLYEIYIDKKRVLVEDMAKWRFENFITINNLNLNSEIEIRVKTLRDNVLKSWSNASELQILESREIATSTLSKEQITCTSPYSITT